VISSVESSTADLLSIRQAAALVHRTPETVRRWVWSGRLPAQRDGRRLLVARADLVRLVAGPIVEITDLAQWHLQAVDQARRSSRAPEAPASAMDLIVEDRQTRHGPVPAGDAGR
jgi:excisionase family DNA binding protein